MNHLLQKSSLCMCAGIIMVLAGCQSSPARYIQTGGQESVVSVGEVDIQDLINASRGLLDSLIENDVLRRGANQPAILATGAIYNDTGSRFNIEELTMRIRERLVNSGRAQVFTTRGVNAEDAVAKEEKELAEFTGESSVGRPTPDFSLTGRITEIKRRAGSVRQTTYTFRLTLTDVRTGLEVWTKSVDFTKQGTRPSVSW